MTFQDDAERKVRILIRSLRKHHLRQSKAERTDGLYMYNNFGTVYYQALILYRIENIKEKTKTSFMKIKCVLDPFIFTEPALDEESQYVLLRTRSKV